MISRRTWPDPDSPQEPTNPRDVTPPPSPPSAASMAAGAPPADEEIICHCFGVDRGTIIQAILQHQPVNLPELTRHCKAGNGCMSCWSDLHELLERYRPL